MVMFGSNLKKADNLFIATIMRGRVSPEQIVDQYKYSEQRRFAFMRDMYKDIGANGIRMPDNLIRRELEKEKVYRKMLLDKLCQNLRTKTEFSL